MLPLGLVQFLSTVIIRIQLASLSELLFTSCPPMNTLPIAQNTLECLGHVISAKSAKVGLLCHSQMHADGSSQ